MEQYILALDLGTTGNRVIAFDKGANIVAKYYAEFSQYYPREGWVEHDPLEILTGVQELLEYMWNDIPPERIAAIGITNQRETTVCWDVTGEPLANAIVWQDCRTQDRCRELRSDVAFESYVRNTTGLPIDPYFSATKMEWLLRNASLSSNYGIGTIESWIAWNLTGRHVTDHTNASRTMLYNLHTNNWDDFLLKKFGLCKWMLPSIVDSSGIFGYLGVSGIPVAGIAGDQQAALFGQRCFTSGQAKNTYGTGCFCLMNTGKEPVFGSNGLLTTVGIALNGEIEYALEGSVFVGGAVVQWLRDELGIIGSASETEEICTSLPDAGGVYVVPAFAGLGTPYWNKDVRGAVFGLTRGTGRRHLVRAAVESIAYQSKDLVDVMEADGMHMVPFLNVDGGATRNSFLMQFQADILGKRIVVPAVEETTALGAAFLAGLAVGYWSGRDELSRIVIPARVFEPQMLDAERRVLCDGWRSAVQQLLK